VGAQVVEMAKARHLTAAQLSLLWCKDQPGITAPIVGPRTLGHLDEFIPVLDMTLSDEDRPLFDALVHPGNAVADFHNSNEWMKARVS
jgi:aryl-alcohol dehydrogenase-like predicted oxidoreductase